MTSIHKLKFHASTQLPRDNLLTLKNSLTRVECSCNATHATTHATLHFSTQHRRRSVAEARSTDFQRHKTQFEPRRSPSKSTIRSDVLCSVFRETQPAHIRNGSEAPPTPVLSNPLSPFSSPFFFFVFELFYTIHLYTLYYLLRLCRRTISSS